MKQDKKLLILLLILLLTYGVVVTAEELTLTTYYPAPFGDYERMRLVPSAGPADMDDCFSNEEGIMRYDSFSSEILICRGTPLKWSKLGGASPIIEPPCPSCVVPEIECDNPDCELTVGKLMVNGSGKNRAIEADYGIFYGLHAEATHATGTGVYGAGYTGVLGIGKKIGSNTEAFGVYGTGGAPSLNYFTGVFGNAITGTVRNYGVFGTTSGASGGASNWAGYFDGRGYFSDRLGIGTENPVAPLHVSGPGNQFIDISSTTNPDGFGPSYTRLMAVTSNGVTESQLQYRRTLRLVEGIGGSVRMQINPGGDVDIRNGNLRVGGTQLEIRGNGRRLSFFTFGSGNDIQSYDVPLYINYSSTQPVRIGWGSGASLDVRGDITVSGGGTKFFTQPHPRDSSKEISYVTLEGREHRVFFDGTATLRKGVGIVQVPEDFRLVSSEENLNVILTPFGETQGLYVAKRSLDEIVVKERDEGKSDISFGYFVIGTRKGFEIAYPVRENTHFLPMEGMTKEEFEANYIISEKEDDKPYTNLGRKLTRGLLISNGTLLPNGKVNPETATRLGWEFSEKVAMREEREKP